MSEYAAIRINNLSLYWFRNYLVNDVVGLLYSANDLCITPNYIADPEEEDCNPITKYEYVTTVEKAQERLDALGYSLNRMESLFNEKRDEIIDYDPFLSHLNVDYDLREERAHERAEKYITFKKFVNSINKIVNYEMLNGKIDNHHKDVDLKLSSETDKLIYYSLTDDNYESYYGFKTEEIHIGYIFRLILAGCNKDEHIALDFTNLSYWDEDSIIKAMDATKEIERTIVLVEGTSDKDILEFAIGKLYPHLSDVFYFMDFSDGHGNQRSGGAPEMIRCMETFYYSKLKSRFIAVFDNDAEGYISRIKLLSKIKVWPDNFSIMCYPSIDEFKSYPTIASNGKILHDDINKKACSIELYLPDGLIKSNGDYLPIEWESRRKVEELDGSTGYLYQGVVSNKDDIKRNFHNLRKRIEAGKVEFNAIEWDRLNKLLKSIIFAF